MTRRDGLRLAGLVGQALVLACGDPGSSSDGSGTESTSTSTDDGSTGSPATGSSDTASTNTESSGTGSDAGSDTSTGSSTHTGMACPWPSAPVHVPLDEEEGSLSVIFRAGDALFTRWLGNGIPPSGVSIYRTRLPELTHTLLWQGDASHDLLGASDDCLFVGERNDEPLYLTVEVLDHDGAPVRTVELGELAVGISDCRVGDALYVVSGGELHVEEDGIFRALDIHGEMVSYEPAAEILVFDGSDSSLCVLDEPNEQLAPCVTVPESLPSMGSWLGVTRAGYRDGTFALLGLTEYGRVIALEQGSGWEVIETPGIEWAVNGLDAVPGGWLWLRQESLDIDQFVTKAVRAEGEEITDIWTVDGQAFGNVGAGEDCGYALAIKNQGLHVVGWP